MDWYAVAVVPSIKVSNFVDKYRQRYAKYTDYIIPPHITISPVFFITNSNEKEVINALQEAFSGTPAIKVTCQSINYFQGKTNNVAYFELTKDSAFHMRKLLIKAIKALENKITNVFDDDNYTPAKYTPHMTIS